MSKERGSVRIGPVSIFALVIILCLSVLAVLSISTANAGWALAQRQASYTADLYDNEQAGQRFLMSMDDQLAKIRSGKLTTNQALTQLKASVQSLAEAACTSQPESGVDTLEAETTATASVAGKRISAQFHSAKGHDLLIELEIRDDGTYQITSWKTTTSTDAEDEVKLWSGDNP